MLNSRFNWFSDFYAMNKTIAEKIYCQLFWKNDIIFILKIFDIYQLSATNHAEKRFREWSIHGLSVKSLIYVHMVAVFDKYICGFGIDTFFEISKWIATIERESLYAAHCIVL